MDEFSLSSPRRPLTKTTTPADPIKRAKPAIAYFKFMRMLELVKGLGTYPSLKMILHYSSVAENVPILEIVTFRPSSPSEPETLAEYFFNLSLPFLVSYVA